MGAVIGGAVWGEVLGGSNANGGSIWGEYWPFGGGAVLGGLYLHVGQPVDPLFQGCVTSGWVYSKAVRTAEGCVLIILSQGHTCIG